MRLLKKTSLALLLLSGSFVSASAETPLPDAIAAPAETVVLMLHAEGAQVYECKAGADGKTAWAFREPIATLLLDGKPSAGTPRVRTGNTATAAPWLEKRSATRRAPRRRISPGSSSR
jgi:hypothetical protein